MTLPDAQARETITRDLDTNLVVEAAAGTGKTTAMVARIMNLMQHGHHKFAAVTFTHKAATELRQRLEHSLAQRLANEETPAEEKANLAAAEAALADCHIGTIHSFCARLLRERPVEAGISPDFRELDDSEDKLLRTQAWNDFARQLSRGMHRDLYAVFETFGLDLDTLGQGFLTFADYPDIDEWTGRDAGLHQIDAAKFVTAAEGYCHSLAPLAPALENADAGTDALMPICQILLRRFPRLKMPLALDDAHRLAGLFKNAPKTTQKQWAAIGVDKDALAEFTNAYQRFYDETVQPFKNACLAAAYAAALEAYHLTRDIYDTLRLENGTVNFQDLLLTTARMLRDYPEVRADLAEQYERLLVDEVQDTDPVQAEIMFLLAGADPRERDWRRCAPRPGALFIVGDPKQSIYRFRRADITIYQEIKRLIHNSGGEILGLASNFRSRPEILEWVNETFCPKNADAKPGCFTEEETPYSPAYVPLRNSGDSILISSRNEYTVPGIPPFHGVYRLETIAASKKDGIAERDIIADEAARIARFIRHAVDTKMLLPDRDGARAAQPGDFLVITYDKSKAGIYADAIRALGLECRVSGGGTLGASAPLRLLAEYLAAIDNPDDPIALTAVLRGRLFGISDPELYAWGIRGQYTYFPREICILPPDSPPSPDSRIPEIFARMRAHAELLKRNSPDSALANIARDLGLWALAAMGDDPSTQTGALATALELLKKEKPATLGALRERLDWLRDNDDKDPLPATESAGNAVRVMNLHKTKGLEAPVVFLACTRGVKKHDPSLSVQRGDKTIRAALALRGGQHGATLLARPMEWDTLAQEEELFLAAEKTRLNYVAATRAGAALIVSLHQSEKQWKTAFLPQYEHGKTIPTPLPEPEAAKVAAPQEITHPDLNILDETIQHAAESHSALRIETYMQERAKESGGRKSGDSIHISQEKYVYCPPISPISPVPPEQAAAYGEVLHRALSGSNYVIAELLRSFELPEDLLPVIEETVRKVRNSELWRRAKQSPEMYQEIPFTLYAQDAGAKYTRGVIDLIFRNETGWTIVDFKSDAVTKSALQAAAQQHKPQLRAYARAWEALTQEPVTETALYFLHPDACVPVNTESQTVLF